MRALVVTVSTRAAAGVYPDRSGPVIVDALSALGFDVDGPHVVPDGPQVRDVLEAAVAAATVAGLVPGAAVPSDVVRSGPRT